MKPHRLLIPFATLSLALAACGGGGPTQAPGGATTNPGGGGGGTATDVPQATDGPVATQSGGGGSTANGQAHFEITGPEAKSGDLEFLPVGSHFAGMDREPAPNSAAVTATARAA